MKLLFKDIDKKNSGTIGLIAEEAEDMWHAYNLISNGDFVRSSTVRRIVNESSTGLTTTSRVHTTLTLCVESLDFDTQASVLRVKGTNSQENQFVRMGAYHTIDLELNRKFNITKTEWDSVALERIQDACDPAQNADLAAVVMQEGLAHVCLILSSMTLVKSKIEMVIPKKRKGLCANHDKGLEKFFERIVQALVTHINFDIVKAVIIGSPGFIKDQFFEFMNAYAIKNIPATKVLVDNKSKFLLIHTASGFKHSLQEIFKDQNLASRLTDTKALGEVKLIDAFYQMLKSEPMRAFYGVKHVEKANEADAIDILLITDSLFRSKELKERKRYVKIVDSVRENNGTVKIFSSLHVSGEQLLQLTGIAAILRFPMPDIEEIDESDEDSDDQENLNENETNETSKLNNQASNNIVFENPIVEEVKEKKQANLSTASASFSKPINSASTATSSSSSAISIQSSTTNKNTNKKQTKKFSNKENYNDDDYDMDDYRNNRHSNYDYDEYDF